jgi:hypothetical protein
MYRVAVTMALAIALLPGSLHAQSPISPEAATYRARLDSLLPEYRAASRALALADSMRDAEQIAAQRQPLDSVWIPPFMLVTPHSKSGRVFPVFRGALADRRALLAQLDRAPVITLLIEKDSPYRAFRPMRKAPRHHIVSLRSGEAMWDHKLAANAIDDALLDLAPPSVQEWLADGRITHGRDGKSTYRLLATSPSRLAKRCYAGVIDDCLTALGLGAPLDSTRGYSNADIRTLAVRRHGSNSRAYANCRDAGIIEQCYALLRPYGGPPLPLGKIPRSTFLVFALERGGAGAMARLHAGGPDPKSAIAAAARADLQTIAREWRNHIEATKPVANAGTGRAGLVTLLWAAAAMLFSLRSTRRRLQ